MKYSILFIALVVITFGCQKKAEEFKPQVEVITESIYASATVQPQEMYEAHTTVSGILEELYVEEGDLLKEGDVIVKVKSQTSERAFKDAVSNDALARENFLGSSSSLNSLKDELCLAEEQMAIDSLNFARQQRLWDQQIGSKMDLENMKLKYERSKNQYSASEQRVSQAENELRNNYSRSQNMLQNAKSVLEDHSLKSLIDGKVYELYKKEGELVNSMQPIALIGKENSFLLEMLIDEVDIAKVRLGQEVYVNLDAYKDEVFQAKVTKIYPAKNVKNQTFMLEAEFVNPPDVLYSGLSGEANIVISDGKKALVIPRSLILEGNKVLTTEGEVEVTLGMEHNAMVEVVSGIDSTTVILKKQ